MITGDSVECDRSYCCLDGKSDAEAGVTGHTVELMRHVVPGNGVYHGPCYAFYLELYGCCLALGLFFTPAKEEIRNVRIMVRPHCLTEYRG